MGFRRQVHHDAVVPPAGAAHHSGLALHEFVSFFRRKRFIELNLTQ
jgi:hypothetical protein